MGEGASFGPSFGVPQPDQSFEGGGHQGKQCPIAVGGPGGFHGDGGGPCPIPATGRGDGSRVEGGVLRPNTMAANAFRSVG